MTVEEIEIVVTAKVEEALKEFQKFLPAIKQAMKQSQEAFSKMDMKEFSRKVNQAGVFVKKKSQEMRKSLENNNIKIRVWERGSGETLACGTGACSSVVASSLNGYTDRKVNVQLLGGNLEIEWKPNNHVHMTGPAVTVFKGEWIDE